MPAGHERSMRCGVRHTRTTGTSRAAASRGARAPLRARGSGDPAPHKPLPPSTVSAEYESDERDERDERDTHSYTRSLRPQTLVAEGRIR
jgi:hypothetical protein